MKTYQEKASEYVRIRAIRGLFDDDDDETLEQIESLDKLLVHLGSDLGMVGWREVDRLQMMDLEVSPAGSEAIIKFNSGVGALLCNKCSTIISTGFEHEDKIHLCDKCKEVEDE